MDSSPSKAWTKLTCHYDGWRLRQKHSRTECDRTRLA